ncbi:hypothetical protein ADK64_36660 [Streptomyces sp. MMG1121]|nr:hypothetical protein ADK64_36660 [Streptomyces sp. MMG1121]
MTDVEVADTDSSRPCPPEAASAGARWRAWLLQGLSERTARHPGPHPERPDGIKIAAIFILAILTTSFGSRVPRAFELRVTEVRLDAEARRIVDRAAAGRPLQLIAHKPPGRHLQPSERIPHGLTRAPISGPPLFLEVSVQDSSDFTADVTVHGTEPDGAARLTMQSPAVPNTIAAILLALRDRTGEVPHVYFNWSEGGPVSRLLRFLVFGGGEVATVTREVLRRAEPDPERRPRVHVS